MREVLNLHYIPFLKMTSGLLKNNEKVCISVYGMRVKCCVAYNLLFNLNRMREKKKLTFIRSSGLLLFRAWIITFSINKEVIILYEEWYKCYYFWSKYRNNTLRTLPIIVKRFSVFYASTSWFQSNIFVIDRNCWRDAQIYH